MLKGSRTEANLLAAFAGESQAHTKYQYYSSQAKKDGYVQISKIFAEVAHNEKEHAKLWFKLLKGGSTPTTTVNLKDAISGENFEWTDMYAKFADEAREEGFEDIAKLFDGVAQIEKEHEAKYAKLLENIESGKVFVKEEEKMWQCSNCGHTHTGKESPTLCPVCAHPQAYFEVLAENY